MRFNLTTSLIGFLAVLLMSVQLCFYYQNGGNLILMVQNELDSKEFLEIETLLEGELVLKADIQRNQLIPEEIVNVITFGKKTLDVKCQELGFYKTYSFHSFLVRWVVVDVFEEEIVINSYFIPPFFP